MKRSSPIGNLLAERLQVASEGYRASKKEGFESACNEFIKGLLPEMELSGICSVVASFVDQVKGALEDINLGDITDDKFLSNLLDEI